MKLSLALYCSTKCLSKCQESQFSNPFQTTSCREAIAGTSLARGSPRGCQYPSSDVLPISLLSPCTFTMAPNAYAHSTRVPRQPRDREVTLAKSLEDWLGDGTPNSPNSRRFPSTFHFSSPRMQLGAVAMLRPFFWPTAPFSALGNKPSPTDPSPWSPIISAKPRSTASSEPKQEFAAALAS